MNVHLHYFAGRISSQQTAVAEFYEVTFSAQIKRYTRTFRAQWKTGSMQNILSNMHHTSPLSSSS